MLYQLMSKIVTTSQINVRIDIIIINTSFDGWLPLWPQTEIPGEKKTLVGSACKGDTRKMY
jgi:hypothetical protein